MSAATDAPARMSRKDAFDVYEAGKHRRYGLLFAVHGGAFALARLARETGGNGDAVAGALTVVHLATGMVVFTAVMAWDIWAFGMKLRRGDLPDAFGPPGRIVLVLIAGLLAAAWLLAGFG